MDDRQRQDHDLLVEIKTKLDRALVDIKELKDNVASRVSTLEGEIQIVRQDIVSLQNWRWYVIGIATAISLLLPYIIYQYAK